MALLTQGYITARDFHEEVSKQKRLYDDEMRRMHYEAALRHNPYSASLESAIGSSFVGHQLQEQQAAQPRPVPNPEPNPVLLLTGEDE